MERWDGPLRGIRVLDLGRMMAGPFCGTLLSLMGAEVIKIENEAHFDTLRILPPAYEGQPGMNRSFVFNLRNVNKKSFLVDLSQEAGRDLFLELVKVSDVVLENFAPQAMARRGLGYDSLKKVRPDIIMASLSGFGTTGPEKDFVSYATVAEAMSGLTGLNGFPSQPPNTSGIPFPDYFVSSWAALAIATVLIHRDFTGQGQFIDMSQLEATVALFPEGVLDWQLNQRLAEPVGNTRKGFAPWGVYRCKGDDNWVAIHISTDREWEALYDFFGKPSRLDNGRFATVLGRWERREELNVWLEQQVRAFGPTELVLQLQARGIKAAPSASNLDLLHDPHVRARGILQEVQHPITKTGVSLQTPWRLSATPSHIESAGPLFGEHTEGLLRELLGVGSQQIALLQEQKVLA